MLPQWVWTILFLLTLLLLIWIAEFMHRNAGFPAERSRKFVHVTGGLICLALPYMFRSHWWVLALTGATFGLLLFTYLRHQLNSIHQTQRRSLGSILFPIPVYICFLIAVRNNDGLFFYLPVSLLTISDTAAEIGGQKWGKRMIRFFGGQKSLAGTLSFFLTAVPLTICWLHFYHGTDIEECITPSILISGGAALAELAGMQGWDNLTVPAVTMLLYGSLI